MSNTNDQGPQNLAQAEAEALRALESGAWRVWQAGSGPLPAAYARWCATEIGLATAALRERAEKAEDEHEESVVRNNRALRERAEKAEAALAKMAGECERFCADYQREYVRARKAEAEVAAIKQAISDPENQPSQFGTVPVAMLQAANRRADSAEDEVSRLKGLLEKRPEPYTPRVGDSFSWDGRHFIFAGPAAPAGPYVPRVGDVVEPVPGHGHEGALFIINTFNERSGWYDFGWLRGDKDGTKRSMNDGSSIRVMPVRYVRPSTPAERAAAGLPVEPAQPLRLRR